MGYHSKAVLLLRGLPEEADKLVSNIRSRSKVVSIPGDMDFANTDHWGFLADNLCPVSTKSDGTVVLRADLDWFKAYASWDIVVEEVVELCTGYGLDYSYARIGEVDDDFYSDSNSPTGHIELVRDFDIPEMYE